MLFWTSMQQSFSAMMLLQLPSRRTDFLLRQMLDGFAGLVELGGHGLQRGGALLQPLQLLLKLLLQAGQLLRRQLVDADLLRLLCHGAIPPRRQRRRALWPRRVLWPDLDAL